MTILRKKSSVFSHQNSVNGGVGVGMGGICFFPFSREQSGDSRLPWIHKFVTIGLNSHPWCLLMCILKVSLFLSWSLSNFSPFPIYLFNTFLFLPPPSSLPFWFSVSYFLLLSYLMCCCLYFFYHFSLEITVNFINANDRETRCDAWAEARGGPCQYWFIAPLTLGRPWMLIWLAVETKAGLLLSNLNSVSCFEGSYIPSDPFDFSYWVLFLSIPTKGFLS